MHLIEKISSRFAEKVSAELHYDSEKQEVIAYGAFALMQMTVSIALVVLFGWLFGVLPEALTVSFAASILRKYTGGLHATSPVICVIIGTIASIGFGLLARADCFENLYIMLGFIVFVYLFGFITAFRKAPVESKNKPISDGQKKRMKKSALILLGIYFLAAAGLVVGFVLSSKRGFLTFSVCISIGVLWQMFTLTKAGEIILGGIDSLLDKVLSLTKRRR